MQIEVFKSKIHRVTITEANLSYVGSITIDEDLLDAANMIAGEKVQMGNVSKLISSKGSAAAEPCA